MNLSPSPHQEIAISRDLQESFDYIPAGQPVVRHDPGTLTLITQCDPRLGPRTNNVYMRWTMIVRVDHHPQPPKPKNGRHDCNQTLGFIPRLLAERRGQIRGAEVGVALEHLQRLVSGDGGDLHYVQPLLEESAGSLVPQVVEAEPRDAGTAHGALEGVLESVCRKLAEDTTVQRSGEAAQNRYGAARQRHTARLAVLGHRQERDAALEIHV
jgi:hypothetical protein